MAERINTLVAAKTAGTNTQAQMDYLDALMTEAAQYASTGTRTENLAALLDVMVDELAWGRLHRATTGSVAVFHGSGGGEPGPDAPEAADGGI